jgi:isopentenyl-diphosphate delta-isomerase
MSEQLTQFENRKKDHIRIALSEQAQAQGLSGLEQIKLIHEALPELNFSDINISKNLFSYNLKSPLFISSMTAGHAGALQINTRLAQAAERHGWAMGVGSQRKELFHQEAAQEWKLIRKQAPSAVLFGNLGLAQLIQTPLSEIQRLVENLQASAIFIHCNALQEVLQAEGTADFKGGLKAIENLCQQISIPVIVKEVGCGFSASTLLRLKHSGVYAVDVAGLGGTHWGRVEGFRSAPEDMLFKVAQTFKDWGLSTTESIITGKELNLDYKLWASGGVRTGLDAAKLLALGAEMVGFAKPVLESAMQGDQALDLWIQQMQYELKVALFCTGSADLHDLNAKRVWTWK